MDSNPISMLERPQTVRRGTLRKYTSPTRTVGAGKCFSPAAGVEKLCRIFQIDTTSFLTGCTQMTASGDYLVRRQTTYLEPAFAGTRTIRSHHSAFSE